MINKAFSHIVIVTVVTLICGCRFRSSDASIKEQGEGSSDGDKFNFGFELKDENGTTDILGKPQPYTAAVVESVAPYSIAQISGLLPGDWLKALEWKSSTGQVHFYSIHSVKEFRDAVDLIRADQVTDIGIYGGAKGAKGEDKKGVYKLKAYPAVSLLPEGGRCITKTLPLGVSACYCSRNGSHLDGCKQVETAESCKVGSSTPSEDDFSIPIVETIFEKGLKCSP